MLANTISNSSQQSPLVVMKQESSSPAGSNSVTSSLTAVHKSSEELSRIARNKPFIENLIHRMRDLWPSPDNGQSTEANAAEESIELEEILTEGKNLRLQAESLYTSRDEQAARYDWRGGALKRYLIAAGILSGAGVLVGIGYQYYASRNSHNGNISNFILPASVEPLPNMTALHHSSDVPDRTTVSAATAKSGMTANAVSTAASAGAGYRSGQENISAMAALHHSSDAPDRTAVSAATAKSGITANAVSTAASAGADVGIGAAGAGVAVCTNCYGAGSVAGSAGAVAGSIGKNVKENLDTEQGRRETIDIMPDARETNKIPSSSALLSGSYLKTNEIPNFTRVEVGKVKTVTDSTSVLTTDGLGDCSALIVLSDWSESFYRSRTLIHLTGSNVLLGLRNEYGRDASKLISDLQKQLVNRGGKVIWVAGDNSQSDTGISTAIGQSNDSGEKPIYELMKTPSVSVEIAASIQVAVHPDGTFDLGDTEGRRGMLTREKVNEILTRAAD